MSSNSMPYETLEPIHKNNNNDLHIWYMEDEWFISNRVEARDNHPTTSCFIQSLNDPLQHPRVWGWFHGVRRGGVSKVKLVREIGGKSTAKGIVWDEIFLQVIFSLNKCTMYCLYMLLQNVLVRMMFRWKRCSTKHYLDMLLLQLYAYGYTCGTFTNFWDTWVQSQ